MSPKNKSVYIKTFGCSQNMADSERIKAFYWEKGWKNTETLSEADEVVINTCIVRESAENRAWGLVNKVNTLRKKTKKKIKIVVTGCAVGAYGQKDIKGVDEWVKIDKFLVWDPIREKRGAALVSISTGCDNHCSFCIVPKARGKERSRTMADVLAEIDRAIETGFLEVVLIGQNVNSYGSDFGGESWVHMGKKRIKSLFPTLLELVAKKNLKKISFISSNPWDFSDELIGVIAKYENIDRLLHLPFQSGNDEILKKMNRSYTKQEYLDLVENIKSHVPGVKFSTDVIIGFSGETEEMFEDTVDVCKTVGFDIAYLNKYSPRIGTVSAKLFADDVPWKVKKERWTRLNDLVNKKSE
ncbi:MAG: MiaB/RimO family radical SAM methylthiotransferase [Candidatus Shapirobacteria bacterium]